MVLAGNDACSPAIFIDNRIGSVSADVVECVHVALTVHAQEKGKAGLSEANVITSLGEAMPVSNKQPFLGKDGALLKFVHLRRAIP